MTVVIISLRLLHVLAGVYWVGSALFLALEVGPSLAATGAAGGTVLLELRRRRYHHGLLYAALVVIASALGLMRALASAGDRAAALQHYRVYEMLLRQELELEPDAEVKRLADQLREAGSGDRAPFGSASARPGGERVREAGSGKREKGKGKARGARAQSPNRRTAAPPAVTAGSPGDRIPRGSRSRTR